MTLVSMMMEMGDVSKVEGMVQEVVEVVGVVMEIFMVVPEMVELVEPSGLH